MPPRRRIALLAVGLLLPVALTACGSGRNPETYQDRPTVDAATASVGDLEVRNIKIAPPAGSAIEHEVGGNATATMSIVNMGEGGDRLLTVSTPAATSVELLDGSGAPAARVDVPPLGVLGEGDFSVRLKGLTQALRPGQHVPVTVTFFRGGRRELLVPVAVYTSPVPRPTYDVFEHHEPEPAGRGSGEGQAEGPTHG